MPVKVYLTPLGRLIAEGEVLLRFQEKYKRLPTKEEFRKILNCDIEEFRLV